MSFRATRPAALAVVATAATRLHARHNGGARRDRRHGRLSRVAPRGAADQRQPCSIAQRSEATTTQHFRGGDPPHAEPQPLGQGSRARLLSAARRRRARGSTTVRRIRRLASSSTTSISRGSAASVPCSTSTASKCCVATGTRYGRRARRSRLHALAAPSDELCRRLRSDDRQRRHGRARRCYRRPDSATRSGSERRARLRERRLRDDAFLGRNDTYRRDELTARGKLAWAPSDDLQVDFTGLYIDVDNGYDAWAHRQRLQHLLRRSGSRRAAIGCGIRARACRAPIASTSSASPVSPTPTPCSVSTPTGEMRRLGAVRLRLCDGERPQSGARRARSCACLSKPGAIADGAAIGWPVCTCSISTKATTSAPSASTKTLSADRRARWRPTPRLAATTMRRTSAAVRAGSLSMTDGLGVMVGFAGSGTAPTTRTTMRMPSSPDDDMLGGELAFDWRLSRAALSVCAPRARLQGGRFQRLARRRRLRRGSTTSRCRRSTSSSAAESLTSIEAGVRATSAMAVACRRWRVRGAPRRPAESKYRCSFGSAIRRRSCS